MKKKSMTVIISESNSGEKTFRNFAQAKVYEEEGNEN